MKDFTWLDNLKIRGSYGSLGNNTWEATEITTATTSRNRCMHRPNYVLGRAVQWDFLNCHRQCQSVLEMTYITNLGVDYNMFSNRLSGSLEFFNKKTDGILIDLPAPMVHGNATIPKQNAAQVTNKGVEFSVNWSDRVGKDFTIM